MKRTILYTAFAALLLTTAACSGDFIDKAPELQINEQAIFGSESRLAAAIEGMYTRLKEKDDGYFLGGYATLAGDNRSDDMIIYGNNGYTFRDCYSHAVNPSSMEGDYLYKNAYLAINYTNTLLEGLETTYAASLPCDEATADRYIQECKFVRAISYYYLSQLFGQPYKYDPQASNVPLRIKAITGAGENVCPPATISQVFEQILADTEDVSALPIGYGDNGFSSTKASQAAAHALRMRVYMCMENWDKAIEEGDKVEGFTLIPSIATMFDAPYALTEENIFSIPMTETDKSNSQTHPSGYFTHEAGQITVVNNINGIATTYGIEADARTGFLYTDAKGYTYCEKYTEYATRYEWLPIFRYAEILLHLAECYYNKGAESLARQYVKMVRTRSIEEASDPLVKYTESGPALWTVIDNERRWEFLSEGIRGFDISRRADDYRHPLTDGSWTVVATPADRTTYCWAFPLYETTVNTALSN
ncbi:RagB/SusD family nutrient uptake outer membrane protein [Parabacteroides sp.]